MKIVNESLQQMLTAGQTIALELGSGTQPIDGLFHLDLVEMPGVDVVADLNFPLSCFPDSSVKELYANHVFEHVSDFLQLMQEVHRICTPEAVITIEVPHHSNPLAYSDPTHVRLFGLYSMCYFIEKQQQVFKRKVPDFYIQEKFILHNVILDFEPKNTVLGRIVCRNLQNFINAKHFRQEFYEKNVSRFFPVSNVKYIISPLK